LGMTREGSAAAEPATVPRATSGRPKGGGKGSRPSAAADSAASGDLAEDLPSLARDLPRPGL
jgi:hypothetical protein